MKIIHLCVSCFYIDGFAYQENELVAQNIADGHDVLVIASTETYDERRKIIYVQPGEYFGIDGVRVIRLPYSKFLPHAIMRKLRVHPRIYEILENEAPDIILFHGLCGWELNTVARYKRAHPKVKLYVDSHEDFNNSARTFASRYFLHFAFYRWIARRCVDSIDKILCISIETIDFVRGFYGLPESKIEFFPLGGSVFGDNDYLEERAAVRGINGITSDDILFIQSGKMDRKKKLLESLHAFSKLEGRRFRFFIVGHLHEDVADEVRAFLRTDNRIRFLGWRTAVELRSLLCAADVYVQPGTQSATMQMSLCCRCAVILDDVPSHTPFVIGNGWLVGRELCLYSAFRLAAESTERLPMMSQSSASIASQLLDYRVLASRLYI